MEIKLTIGTTPELQGILQHLVKALTSQAVMGTMQGLVKDLSDLQQMQQNKPLPNFPKGGPDALQQAENGFAVATPKEGMIVEQEAPATDFPDELTNPIDPVATEAPAKKVRGKNKPKVVDLPAPVATAPAAAPEKPKTAPKPTAPVDDLTGQPLATNGHDKEFSKEDLVAATQNAVFRNGNHRDKIREYLDEAACNKVTDLPVANWPAYIAFAESLS